MAKKSTKKQTKVTQEKEELQAIVKALEGTQHNPVAWLPIIRLVAPVIARLAIRLGLSVFARKTGRRIRPSVRDFVADDTAKSIRGMMPKK